MNIEASIQIYPMIRELLGDKCPIALGGYPALVKQGILKESRETKDIDICLFRGVESQRLEKDIHQQFFNSISAINEKILGKKYDHLGSERYWVTRTSKSVSLEDDGDIAAQNDILKNNLGVNKSMSILLERRLPIKPKPSAEISSEPMDAGGMWFTAATEKMVANWKANGMRYTGYGDPSILWGTVSSTPEETAEYLRKKQEEAKAKKILLDGINSQLNELYGPKDVEFLNEFFTNCNISRLELDLFFMPFKYMKRSTVIVDGERYVHYYTILKAKYEYCVNGLTNDEGFEKHINDLKESYLVKHIDGVNSPKDIEFLIKKRNESKS